MKRPRPSMCFTILALAAIAVLQGCDNSKLDLVGTVERQNLELAAPISERIVELPIEVGGRVAAGAVVVQLDTEVAVLELAAAEARLTAAQVTAGAAGREMRRLQGLRRAQVASEQALDNARKANGEATALLKEREARVAQASKRLEDLTLRSAAAGIVDQIPFSVGERVPAGGVAAVVIADEAPWVRVWIPARATTRLRPGSKAEVQIEGLDKLLEGRVEDIAREPEFTPHYALTEKERAHLVYEARIVLDDAPLDLRPGIPAEVRIPLGSSSDGS